MTNIKIPAILQPKDFVLLLKEWEFEELKKNVKLKIKQKLGSWDIFLETKSFLESIINKKKRIYSKSCGSIAKAQLWFIEKVRELKSKLEEIMKKIKILKILSNIFCDIPHEKIDQFIYEVIDIL